MIEASAATFTGLVDLAAEALGGHALASSDEFFAGADNLVKPGRGVFIEGKFTDRGKWMDGWESRRKRGPGHDWCILELGAPGSVLGFDIDTNHFIGNAPSFASVEGLYAPGGTPIEALAGMAWVELLAQSPLRPGSQNLFAALGRDPTTHLRLNIFPDGGVARFRAFGRVQSTWKPAELDAETKQHVSLGAVDVASLKNGGQALACSDAFFGPMNNLLLPGRAENMGGGWETRRKRGPGHDWILIGLGARGSIQCIEIDTQHFLGNCPARCSIESVDSPDARITDLIASRDWTTLLAETALRPHTRHFFDVAPAAQANAASHLRLNIFPDGGISRLRAWATRR
jgi:allantoicase